MLYTSAWKATLVNGNNARPSLWHLLELLGFCIDHITPKSPNESMRTTKLSLLIRNLVQLQGFPLTNHSVEIDENHPEKGKTL